MTTLTLAPQGLLSNRNLVSAAFNFSQSSPYYIKQGATAAIGFGDLVRKGTSTSEGYIVPYAAADTHALGVFGGCYYYNTTIQQWIFSNQFPSGGVSTPGDIQCYVFDDPNNIYTIQYSGTPTPAFVGQNVELTGNGSPNTITGISTAAANGIATTATLPLRVIGLSTRFMPGFDPLSSSQIVGGTFPTNGWLDVKLNTSEMNTALGL